MVAEKWIGSGEQSGMRIDITEGSQIERGRRKIIWPAGSLSALVDGIVCEYTPGRCANKTRTNLERKENAGARRRAKKCDGT